MKTTITLIILSLPLLAQPSALQDIRKDIHIISNMLETAFNDTDHHRSRDSRHIGVEGTYLRGQGIVLNIQAGGSNHFEFDFNFMPEIHMAEIAAPMHFAPEDVEVTWEAYEEALEELQDVYVDVDEITRETQSSVAVRDAMRALRDAQRKTLKEQKQATRQLRRDLESSRDLDDTQREAIVQQIKEHQTKLQVASKKYSEELAELQTKQRQEWEKNQSEFEIRIVDILCDYGSALRSLPDNEHVSIIFSEGARDEDGDEQDRIYVFDKTDLVACREGRMDKKTLISKGQVYNF